MFKELLLLRSWKLNLCQINHQLKTHENITQTPRYQQDDKLSVVQYVTFKIISTGQNAISQVTKTQASAIEDEFCLLWFAYLDARVLCVGMGVCAGSRFKCHGTDRTLVKDFTVRTLNVRLESRHVRVNNIAMHAAAREWRRVRSASAKRHWKKWDKHWFSSKCKR